jgi:hypothetical protein
MKNLRHAYVRASGIAAETHRFAGVLPHHEFTTPKKLPTEFLASAKRTGDYKYSAVGCRALSPNKQIKLDQIETAVKKGRVFLGALHRR